MKTPDREVYLALRAQCGNRDALEELLRLAQAPLRGYLGSLVGNSDADDVLQDVLVTVFRKLAWLDAPSLFRPWAFRIASRRAFRWLRRRRRLGEEPLASVSSEAMTIAPAWNEELRAKLNSFELPAASRAVLHLHFQQELTLGEVAVILEIPLGR